MKKKINFYKLVLEESSQLSLFDDNSITFEDKVERFIENHDDSDLIQVTDNKVFHLISFDSEHLFGTYGKIDDIETGDHVRGRNREDYSIENIEDFIESFTYFYLDLTSKNIALLNNSSLPDFKNPFSNFLSSHFRTSSIYNINIVSLMTEDLPSSNRNNIPISRIKFSYTDNRLPDNQYLSEREMFELSQNDIKNATVILTMNQGVQKDRRRFSFRRSEYSELKIENENETIDLIENLIIKKTSVDIDEEQLNDSDEIKQILLTSLTDEF